MGIDMGLNKVSFDFMKNDLSGYDFSYSHINNVKFDNAILAAVKFNNCVLSNVNFAFAYIIGADFTGAKFAESVVFQHAFLGAGLLFPNNLWEAYYTKSTDIVVNYVNFGSEKMYISNDVVGWEEIHTGYIFKLFKAGIDSGYWTLEEIYASIDFENELIEKKFQKLLK